MPRVWRTLWAKDILFKATLLQSQRGRITRRCKGCNSILTMHQGESLHSFARRTSCNRVCAAKARPKFNPQAGKETRISNLGIPLIVIVEGNPKCIHWWKNGDPSHGRMVSFCKKCGRTIDELFTPIYEMDFTVNIHFVGMVTTSFFKTSEW